MLGVMPKKKTNEEVIEEVALEPGKAILEPQEEEASVVEVEPVKEEVPPAVAAAAVVEEPKKEKGWVWVLVAFVLGAVVGTVSGYLVAKTQRSQTAKTQNTAVVQTPVPSPSPVTTEIKRSELKVQVLNGSGVVGAASKAKTFLEGLGYADVAAGNADGDFAETEVEVKEGKSSASEMLKDDLKDEYTLADTVGVLDEGSDYDVVITLGSK